MTNKIALLGLAAMTAMAASPAAAAADKGYRVRYVADHSHYCIRPMTANEAERLGIALYKTECHTAVAWAGMGIMVSRG